MVARELLGSYVGVRVLSGRYLGDPNIALQTTLLQLEKRRTSLSIDEPLCIGTLFSLDLARILAHDDLENRMRELWNLFSEQKLIRRSIVFQVAKTLEVPRYSWAFSTFLQTGVTTAFTRNKDMIASIGKHGLMIPGAGITLSPIPRIDGLDSSLQRTDSDAIKGHELFYIRFDDNKWATVSPLGDMLGQELGLDQSNRPIFREIVQQPDRKFVLLQKHLSTDAESVDDRIYVLIEIKGESEEGTICKHHKLVQLIYMDEQQSRNCSETLRRVEDLKSRGFFQDFSNFRDAPRGEAEVAEQKAAHERLIWQLTSTESPDRLGFPFAAFNIVYGRSAIASHDFTEEHKWVIE